MTLKSKQSADFENINNKQNQPTMEIGKKSTNFFKCKQSADFENANNQQNQLTLKI